MARSLGSDQDLTRESATVSYYGYKDEVKRLALGDHDAHGTDVRVESCEKVKGTPATWNVTVSWTPWETCPRTDLRHLAVAGGDFEFCPSCSTPVSRRHAVQA